VLRTRAVVRIVAVVQADTLSGQKVLERLQHFLIALVHVRGLVTKPREDPFFGLLAFYDKFNVSWVYWYEAI